MFDFMLFIMYFILSPLPLLPMSSSIFIVTRRIISFSSFIQYFWISWTCKLILIPFLNLWLLANEFSIIIYLISVLIKLSQNLIVILECLFLNYHFFLKFNCVFFTYLFFFFLLNFTWFPLFLSPFFFLIFSFLLLFLIEIWMSFPFRFIDLIIRNCFRETNQPIIATGLAVLMLVWYIKFRNGLWFLRSILMFFDFHFNVGFL